MIYSKTVFADRNRLPAQPLGKFNSVSALPATGAEIAFLGRSNSGKSSLLATLLQTQKAPQVSSRPGSTRLIQLFQLGSKPDQSRLTLADFPGYGYAQSSAAFRKRFAEFLGEYITRREGIKAICLVMDCRRKVEDEEREISSIMKARHIPTILCLNKADQLNQSETAKIRKEYAENRDFFEIMLVSAKERTNLDYLRNYIASLG
ncbi:MAG: ribosome biogenesis GTP-binding protein YsxC [Leptospiraceae bacterium]|nr:ribosome biogenesis GTP-binding protein YsxC [Leptospiraceae bacterium]